MLIKVFLYYDDDSVSLPRSRPIPVGYIVSFIEY